MHKMIQINTSMNFIKEVDDWGWKLSPVVFYRGIKLQNTTWLSFQPKTFEIIALKSYYLCLVLIRRFPTSQGGFPIKVKAIILINYSWIVNTLLNMVWPFLSAKLRSRVIK